MNDIIRNLSPARRRKVEARAAELVAEEMTLRELRTAHHRTQVTVAVALGIGQEGVSRLEQRTDLLISTLRAYVVAVGGELHVVATFPDRPPVILNGLARMEAAQRDVAKATKPPTAKSRRLRRMPADRTKPRDHARSSQRPSLTGLKTPSSERSARD